MAGLEPAPDLLRGLGALGRGAGGGSMSAPVDVLAVEELIAACRARDALGRRPGAIELIEDCTGQAHAEAAHYDAVQARYRAALAACGGEGQ